MSFLRVLAKLDPSHDRFFIRPSIGKENEGRRHAWIEQKLRSIPSGHRLLDAGAGEMPYRKFCSHLEYVSQDFCQYDGSGNAAGLQTMHWDTSKIDIVGDITRIDAPADSFDRILCSEVMEHIPDARAALTEFQRLLKPGGQLLLTTPFACSTHFAPHFYVTGFSRYYYEKVCSELGFKILECTINGSYFESLAQELRRTEYIAQRYAGGKLGRIDYFCLKYVLRMIERFSKKDAGSSEFCCYGIFLVAEKSVSSGRNAL